MALALLCLQCTSVASKSPTNSCQFFIIPDNLTDLFVLSCIFSIIKNANKKRGSALFLNSFTIKYKCMYLIEFFASLFISPGMIHVFYNQCSTLYLPEVTPTKLTRITFFVTSQNLEVDTLILMHI